MVDPNFHEGSAGRILIGSMQLTAATRLGPYEIVEHVGTGGMGEVYLARDTRLSRNVAIKVLPAALASDSGFRLRLEREARVVSGLSHPHICTLYDIGRQDGLDYLVMEFCDGVTLAERLVRGPLPIDETLEHGIAIAAALACAHRAGIVHRDLKPANVMLTPEGVKLLDFGLASEHEPQSQAHLPATASATDASSLLGTLGYMAPERFEGGEADVRSDVFALGVVLYEMLAGKPAFATTGRNKAEAIDAILRDQPQALREARPGIPEALEHVVEKCLEKDPARRWESAHDVAEQLRWIRDSRRVAAPSGRRRSIIAGALIVLAVVAAVAAWRWRALERTRPTARLSIALPGAAEAGEQASFSVMHWSSNVAISPDGSRVAYTAYRGGRQSLFLRDFASFESAELADTAGAIGPFFSPDGEWVGFMTGMGMKKVRVTGGPAVTITRESRGRSRGAVWAPDGTIYFTPNASSEIRRVSAEGGPSSALTNLDTVPGETSHRWPALLPGGRHLLFTIRTENIRTFDEAKIGVLDLETGERRIVFEGGSSARWSPPGHLVFARGGALYAVPFDSEALEVRGAPRKMIEGVTSGPGGVTGEFDVSWRGDLVYVPGPIAGGSTDVIRVNRAGEATTVATLSFDAIRPALSPDGTTLAVNGVFANDDIYLCNLATGSTQRFSFEPGDETMAVWSADGRHVIYNSLRERRLLIRAVDGSGAAEELVRGVNPHPAGCTPEGALIYSDRDPDTGWDIWMIPLAGPRTPRPLLRTPFNEMAERVSPDGRWLLYLSNESSVLQVFVRSMRPGGRGWQISTEGGYLAEWSPDGNEIFYRRGNEIHAVTLTIDGDEIRPGKPERLFPSQASEQFVAVGDGLLMLRPTIYAHPRPTRIDVVLGWGRELKR